MEPALQITPRRPHLTRLMAIWRSAGWPCRDAIELDLVAAGWATLCEAASGHETIRLTDSGIRLLADSRQRNQRSLSAHDRLAERVAERLATAGRVVWRELSLRAKVNVHAEPTPDTASLTGRALWPVDAIDEGVAERPMGKTTWRMARPDVYSVRHTSVKAYLQPMVHEVKVSRADLLSDLRHAAKRESYQWLSCETYYVFPASVAKPEEVPPEFGVWVLNGTVESGTLDLVRPARHAPCKLPFAVWMALAKSTPARLDGEAMQRQLGEADDSESNVDDA
ncbi:MAG: hypothetical protein H7276_22875, partial [Caulobacter sp.]|nr:hypothetical protein [Vitreoscilla sp.]